MQRFTRTLTAAAMAGTLAFAAVPRAGAQTDAIHPGARAMLENPPEAVTDQFGNYWKLIGGEYVKTELPATADEIAAAPTFEVDADGNLKLNPGTNPLPEAPASAATPADLSEAPEAPVAMPALNVRCGETVWYRTGDGKHYVTEQDRVNGELPVDAAKVRTAEQMEAELNGNCAFVEGVPVATPEGLTPGQIAGIAGAAVAAPLIIGGIAYWLNKDGNTLVAGQDRVNVEPTPEERAESDRLRAEHAVEIAEQQAEQSRGIAAETGSNALARTLFALALASMLGAAAFVAGRRFLV